MSRYLIILPLLALCFGLRIPACASDANRFFDQYEDPKDSVSIKMKDTQAQFELGFEVFETPEVIDHPNNETAAWVFRYAVENRRGVTVNANRLNEGDYLLNDLRTERGSLILKTGSTISKKDLVYLAEPDYQLYFDRSGKPINPDSFKIGDKISIYKRVIDENNDARYLPSGLETLSGITVLQNGTEIQEKELALLRHEALMPVSVYFPVELGLEFYLRLDWPEAEAPPKERYWVLRDGAEDPLLLLSYELKEGDRPVGNIVLPNEKIICKSMAPLREKGPVNSLEVIGKNPHAYMVVPETGNQIVSIDPISGKASDIVAEPGDLVIAPQNKGESLQPIPVRSRDDLDRHLLDGRLSLARAQSDTGPKTFPMKIHLTHYPLPVRMLGIGYSDKLYDVSDSVMSGEYYAEDIKQTITFPPFVVKPIPAFPWYHTVLNERKFHCIYCGTDFFRRQAHNESAEDGSSDIPPSELNYVHPSRINLLRFPDTTKLERDVTYYSQGERQVIAKGSKMTEIHEELRDRAISPVYFSEPAGIKHNIVQCPTCYAWHNFPLDAYQVGGPLGLEQSRNGYVAFPYTERKVNRLDLVVFGLSSKMEPVTGRELALCITFRKQGDEYFQNYIGWEKESVTWKHLPRYSNESIMVKPRPIDKEDSIQSDSSGGSSFDDLLFD